MTLAHHNRVRKNGGKQAVRELEFAEGVEMAESGPTEHEIRQRAHAIYLSRNGAPGNAEQDWLRAEAELRSCRARVRRDGVAEPRGVPSGGQR